MAPQSEGEQLTAAWRALDREADAHGWRIIDVLGRASAFSVMAGRRSPGNEESLLVGIPGGITIEKDSQLPSGQGFTVMGTQLKGDRSGLAWLAVIRTSSGQVPLFTLMAADLVSLLRSLVSDSGQSVYGRLISRIKAWQRFMSRDRPQILTAEEEIGLVGELVVLADIIGSGIPAFDAMESWLGPADGLHDFVLGTGGIEVKSTMAPAGFVAKIGSLDQLENSLYQPLFVGAVRLQQSQAGKTLPEIIDALMKIIAADGAGELFESKLAAAGYLEMAREHYARKFVVRELTYRSVSDESPRLTRSNVPSQVMDVCYSVDLDYFPTVASVFSGVAENFGK